MANEAETTAETRSTEVQGQVSDQPLNYRSDEQPNINARLRQLDVEWVLETARENLGVISSGLLIGGAVGFLLKRKFTVASNLMLAFLLQQALLKQRGESAPSNNNGRSKSDIELERYALKVQRGDYGKLDFIAFK